MFTKKLITSILAVVMMLVLASQSALAQATDPLSVMKASLDAINAGNVDVAVATFADDAVFTTPTGSFKGKDQIRSAIMADVANHVQIEATNFQVAGDKVTYSFKQSNDRLRGLGIDFINAA
jgi:ketosteroid isomerase-like protein